jgi:hypothetical protein
LNECSVANCTSFPLAQPDEDDLTPITNLARPPSWQAVWPVKVYDSLIARFKTQKQDEAGSDEDAAGESEEGAVDDDGNHTAAASRKKPTAGGKLAAMRRRKASMK